MTTSETPELADSGHMSLMDHLAELRRRIIISIVAIAIGATVAWTFYDPIFEFLVDPYCSALEDNGQALVTTGSVEGDSGCGAPLLVTDPLEGFATRLKVSGYVGIALAMPIILYQLWRFIAPGPLRQGATVRPALRGLGPLPLLPRRGAGVLDPAARAGLPHRHRRSEPADGLLAQQVPQPDHLHDAGVRHRLRVPHPAGVPPAGGHPPARHPAAQPPVRLGRASSCSSPSSPRAATRSACSPSPSPWASSTRSPSSSGASTSAVGARPSSPARDRTIRHEPDRSRSTGSSVEAIRSIDEGRSVVVAAPTGSGKTVVAEHAVRDALAHGPEALLHDTRSRPSRTRSSTTSPGSTAPEHVGLLTGDNAIRADAPVVVMTTEVLRNMLYAGSPLLDDLRWVVLDEVHYLEDPYRGPVWEEVVIHLPRTIGPGLPLGDRLQRRRAGRLDRHRARRHRPGHRDAAARSRSSTSTWWGRSTAPTCTWSRCSTADGRTARARDYDIGGGGRRRAGNDRRRWVTPRRAEVVHELHRRHLLPAIYFIFSRAGCDEAAKALAGLGLELTNPAERRRIGAILDEHLAGLGPEELAALDARAWQEMVLGGVAAHHAGMVPPFKEAVEQCFVEGLVKVVFATETLALGINMPARSVVIERLTKFTGEQHEVLTPGQYTQLTGRAGRRGIDDEGHAWVLWSPWVRFDEIAALGREPVVRAALGLPAHLQHGGQPRATARTRGGPDPPALVVRPVPGQPRPHPPRR